jgi:hypothetical protein
LIESVAVAVEPLASVTSKVGEKVPAAVGVPVIAPVEGSSDSPGGTFPDEMLHAYGSKPLVAATELE